MRARYGDWTQLAALDAQIAERLGIGEKTVETQLARGLKVLRDRIRQAQ